MATTHTFSTDTDPALFLEVDDGSGKPARLAAGSNVLVRDAADGTPLDSTTALPLGYLSFTTQDVPAVQVSGGSGLWKGPFYSKEARAAAVTGAGAGSSLLDPDTGQIKPAFIPGGSLDGDYAQLDPATGKISTDVVPDLSGTYAAAADLTATQSQLAGVSDQQTQLMGTAATIDELVGTARIDGFWNGSPFAQTVASGQSFSCWVAPFACKLVQASVVWEWFSLAQNDTNYWRVRLQRIDPGKTFHTVAVKTTQVTGGQAISNRVSWPLDGGTWDGTEAQYAPGDVLALEFTPFGAPAAMKFPLAASFRYVPA